MTPDQLVLLHRVLNMSAAELAELRENFRLYQNAVDKLQSVVGRQTNAECLASMTGIYQELARA